MALSCGRTVDAQSPGHARAFARAAEAELRAARPLPGNEYKVILARNLIAAVFEELSS